MIDMHYDLLSVIYQSYLRMDYSYLKNWLNNYNESNITGVIANLYFMNNEEMQEELGNNYGEINVTEMFSRAVDICSRLPLDAKILFSIEGCDYIKDEEELETLYNLGLRNILLVWNNPNKYASGNNGDYGLTEEGKSFLKKAIDLGISIDLSHMNKKSFYDTISLLKEQINLGKKVKVIASHSNCYKICPHKRNLDDEQILALKEVGGILGLVSYSKFVLDTRSTPDALKEEYLKHIDHAVELIGINSVGVSTDDMTFDIEFYGNNYGPQVFNYSTIKNDLVKLLSQKYTKEEIEKLLYKNVYNKLFKEEEK